MIERGLASSESGPAHSRHGLSGFVRDSATDARIAHARVVLECEGLDGPRELRTDVRGRYDFVELPPGEYSIRVQVGVIEVEQIVELGVAAGLGTNFSLDLGPRDRSLLRPR